MKYILKILQIFEESNYFLRLIQFYSFLTVNIQLKRI